MNTPNQIVIRPALSYAVCRACPLMALSMAMLVLAWTMSPLFILFSFAAIAMAACRIAYARSFRYLITPQFIRFSKGLLFKRTDHLELYRIKDYIVTQSLVLQMLGLMDLTLKSADPENPVITLSAIPASDLVDRLREWVQLARATNPILEIN